MTAWFLKELYDSPAYLAGRAIRFIQVGDNEGVLETSNDALIAALRDLISKRRGGITEVTEEVFLAKKNEPVIVRPKSPPGMLQAPDPTTVRTQIKKPTRAGLSAVAAATGSAKQVAPEPPPKPRTDAAANRPAARNPRTITITKATS